MQDKDTFLVMWIARVVPFQVQLFQIKHGGLWSGIPAVRQDAGIVETFLIRFSVQDISLLGCRSTKWNVSSKLIGLFYS